MSPIKQRVLGIAGCRLVPGGRAYQLQDGTSTREIAVTASLFYAEPCLRRQDEAAAISMEDAQAKGYTIVRTYEAAMSHGLV